MIALETPNATNANAAAATRTSSFDRNESLNGPQFTSTVLAPFRLVPTAT